MEQSIESVTTDATRYGDDWEVNEVVQGKGGITINSYLDDVYFQGVPTTRIANALDLAHWKMMTDDATPPTIFQTPTTLSFIPFDTPIVGSDGVLFMQGYGQYAIAPAIKGLVPIRTSLVGAGPLNRGKILAIGDLTINSGAAHTGAEVAFTVPAGFTRASFHCFNITGADGTFTVAIQSDTTGFPSQTTRLTFPTFTTPSHGYMELAGSNSDTHLRTVITSDNGSNSVLSIIVVGHTL